MTRFVGVSDGITMQAVCLAKSSDGAFMVDDVFGRPQTGPSSGIDPERPRPL
jgi:hypothetical protein